MILCCVGLAVWWVLFAAMIVCCWFGVIVNRLLLVVLFREAFGLLCVMCCLRLLGIVSCLFEWCFVYCVVVSGLIWLCGCCTLL